MWAKQIILKFKAAHIFLKQKRVLSGLTKIKHTIQHTSHYHSREWHRQHTQTPFSILHIITAESGTGNTHKHHNHLQHAFPNKEETQTQTTNSRHKQDLKDKIP
jgi:hypothetical protein